MNFEQGTIILLLCAAMGLFIWNRLRYDVVAGIVLMCAVLTGVVSAEHAFSGFSHPAVITVAMVLIISQALRSSGVVTFFLHFLSKTRDRPRAQLAANCTVTAVLSAFMNNIGALALMLPITLRDARRSNRSASEMLMPLSFASLLGGLVTLIGTPPNIIISTFRAEKTGIGFSMFEFAAVGLVVAICGLLFLVIFSKHLLPKKENSGSDSEKLLSIARYVTELRVPEKSPLIDTTVGDLEKLCDYDVRVLALLRGDKRHLAPDTKFVFQSSDIIIAEGESEALQPLFEDSSLVQAGAAVDDLDAFRSPDVRIIEAVVMPNAAIDGQSTREAQLHQRYDVNLLALAREGRAPRALLKYVRLKVGDVLLLQGETDRLIELCSELGCLALKNRGFEVVPKRSTYLTPGIFAIGILASAFGLLPVQIAFSMVVGALILFKLISLRELYRSVEWPIIVLLGMLIPLGEALQETGATMLIAVLLSNLANDIPLWSLLALIIIVSMILADVIHNTPTAVLMAPIAYSLAVQLSLPADALLMAVAIGAASPYLTPIGHQSNTLVMGPGNYKFSDYWRLGLPLDIVILCSSVPMILLVWG